MTYKRGRMRKVILLAALAAAWAAWAQEPKKEAAKPSAQQAAAPAQPQEAAKPPVQAAAKRAPLARKSRRHQDARHCLEKGSNTEIIRCAEAYL